MALTLTLLSWILEGCNREPTPEPIADSRAFWVIESWDKGVITVLHEDHTYEAACDSSYFIVPSDLNAFHESKSCDLAVDFIGRDVQPFGGKQRDSDGWVVVMWSHGDTLVLRRGKDENSPWRQEDYRITSVTPMP